MACVDALHVHRAELTVLERAEHIPEWVRLTEKGISGQVVQKSITDTNPKGVSRPEGGVAQAARALPVSGDTDEAKRKNVERALKIAGIFPKAKEVARDRPPHPIGLLART